MLDFIVGNEDEVIGNPAYAPITTAFVIVRSDKGFMLLYNKYRRLWELTGGMIEPGETPRDAARRECMEESGQALVDMEFVGLAKLMMRKNAYRDHDSIEYSAVYFSQIEKEEPFNENDEIQEMRWWNFRDGDEGICKESMEFIMRYNDMRAS